MPRRSRAQRVQRMALLDEEGEIVNLIVVDEDAEWAPPEGHTVVPLEDDEDPDWEPPEVQAERERQEKLSALKEKLGLTDEEIGLLA